MARFLKETDYAGAIKDEIKKLVTATPDADHVSAKQLLAEETAIAMIREYIGGKYDCDAIFQPAGETDTRNRFIIDCVITITIYKLYRQTGMKDLPTHRKEEYADVLEWLTKVGAGEIKTTLPFLAEETDPGDLRLNYRPLVNNQW